MIVKRGFVDVPEGQVHYRYASPPKPIGVPLVMLHPSPGSAKMLERYAPEMKIGPQGTQIHRIWTLCATSTSSGPGTSRMRPMRGG